MSNEKKILVTGGAGYIGSHCVIELIKNGYDVLVIDNFCNSSPNCLSRVEKILGRKVEFVLVDIANKQELEKLFQNHKFYAVIHFAALKAVGESSKRPLDYYRNNVVGTINLLECMKQHNVKNFVFSSSATVYGVPEYLPYDEKHPTNGSQITNPYGKTKYIGENILKDLYQSDKSWNIIILRYFNPVGSHESGNIGEDPKGIPNNLMPYISQVAVGRLKELNVFGNDYDTHDGTGVRDYIHISDLASGHNLALKKIDENPGLKIYNLGTGRPYSVLEMVKAFEKVTGITIPYKITSRRSGDLASFYADSSLAQKELGWKANKDVDDMCKDLWNWQSKNPNGFSD